jgi:type IV pilus assembly protein PilP
MRNNSFLIVSCSLFSVFCLLIFSCSSALSEDKGAKDSGDKLLQELDKIPEWIRPPDYKYSPIGKPDPFVSFIQVQKQERSISRPKKSKRILTPLEKVEATQLKLVGIIWYADRPEAALAMVELPDGKGFILKKGALVGRSGGHVVKISPDQVLIQEEVVNIFGKLEKRNIALKLHPSKEESNEQ